MPKEVKSAAAKKTTQARGAAAPYAKKDAKAESTQIASAPRNFGVGGAIQPKRDLRHFVKWPRYVRMQRQKRILRMRLKVPPTINQFSKTVDKATAVQLFKFLVKYKPEDKVAKKARLQTEAEAKAKGEKTESKTKPAFVKFGLNHVVSLIESKKAKLVVLAHDVDPIDLVLYIPTLCKKLGIPYCIVKGKSRLGQIVHQKNATCLAITDVRNEDKAEFGKIVDLLTASFNDRYDDLRKQWGGGILGHRSQAKIAKREKAVKAELSARFG
ncbi:60S large subunit ribosomal protein eL8 (rpL7A) [Andalucia godoyi]|uniref:60S ribosomal protein L7a n=1 Tax=Andalucia godoyi TaxID=505711 RepID=A0A8K0AJF1_ANDGO|nr:60S large subunit ribosomal protein eL8 (rpL7A) [Andalucia godoyi]|eukprot:ANDGO_04253.mRNA.1 60S large subunit ribosomal protein eL8 (rpL7A)